MTAAPLTKGEREELQRLVNRRERVLKQVAAARSADLLADFERQMAAIYRYDQNEVWKAATEKAGEAVTAANLLIAEECKKLDIPSQFHPQIKFSWAGRGESALAERRLELRRVAKSRIKAIEEQALVQIAHEALRASTEIVAHGLTSDYAQQFLSELAPLERLMPPIDFKGVEELLIGQPKNRYARDDVWERLEQPMTEGELKP